MERSSVEICICSAVIQKMQTVPFYTIKVRPLTEELNIGRSTFYEYYGSIYDVVEQMEEDLLPCTPIPRCIDPPYDVLLEHSITSMLRYLQNAEVFCALTGPNGDPGFSARYTRRVREIVTALALRKGCTSSEAAVAAEFIAQGQVASIRTYLRDEHYRVMEPEVFCAANIDMIYDVVNGCARNSRKYSQKAAAEQRFRSSAAAG